jgi:hypothetical protein
LIRIDHRGKSGDTYMLSIRKPKGLIWLKYNILIDEIPWGNPFEQWIQFKTERQEYRIGPVRG